MHGLLVIGTVCLVSLVAAQTTNNNGNPTGEIGSIAFDEIVVHSNLQVRGKSGARGAKALTSGPSTDTPSATTKIPLLSSNATAITASPKDEASTGAGAVLNLKRTKRVPRRNHNGYNQGGYGGGGFNQGGFGGGFPSSSSSAASASSNAFQQNTPFGSYGGGASQTATQSQSFGPHGPQASAAQSASQTYNLPNGNKIDVSFSGGYSFGNKGGPSFSNAHAITVTNPNGQTYNLGRR